MFLNRASAADQADGEESGINQNCYIITKFIVSLEREVIKQEYLFDLHYLSAESCWSMHKKTSERSSNSWNLNYKPAMTYEF